MSPKASFSILVPSACHRQFRQLLPRIQIPTQKHTIMNAVVEKAEEELRGERETEEE